jgi:hypothetical protein
LDVGRAHLLDLFFSFCPLFFLCVGELSNSFNITCAAQINEFATPLHVQHQLSMLKKMGSKMVLQNEKFLVEQVHCFCSVLLLDLFFPHAHELPFFELFEKAKFFDVVIRVSLNQPLTQRDKLDWRVVLVKSETLAT